MDHARAPLLEALADYRRAGRYGYTPPGHRQGRGIDKRVAETIGLDAFRSDVLAGPGLDDRLMRGGYLADAEALMADAVGAETTFFSTCGSSLSVKAAMMAVAGGKDGGLLVARDSHKSIVAGLGVLRSATALDHTPLGRRTAYVPSAVAAAGARGLGTPPGRGGCAHRQPEPIRHLRGSGRHRRGLS